MKLSPNRQRRPALAFLLYCLLLPVYLELTLHLLVYGTISARIVYPVLFALSAGALLLALFSVLSARARRLTAIILSVLLVLYFEIQYVYNSIFGEFMSVWQISFGAEAITNFYQQMIYGIMQAWLPIVLLALPLAVLPLVMRAGARLTRRVAHTLFAIAMCALLHYASLGIMRLSDTSAYSVYRLYRNANTATEVSVKNIGLLSTTRLELKWLLRAAPADDEPAEYTAGEKAQLGDDLARYNMLNIDFDALAQSTQDETLKKLDAYFASQTPTAKSEHTGALEGYNLITICAESFSPYLIDKERTPALYELATNGYIFENFYGSYGSNTTNGEYTFCTGLYPDLSRSKSTASFYASQKNSLPFCLGNIMGAQGAKCYAYHNYTGEYYSRNVTHPNMGYEFYSATNGLDIEILWPSSDLDMMRESVDDYLSSGERFCAYYMTFSGHYQYDWDNPMSAKNRAVVQDLPYSEAVKAYIACNMELEYALQYLLQALEDAGVADKTCIVLTGDHYPYGLSQQQYDELAGFKVEQSFEKYRSSFLCYVPGLQIPVDTYCSTVDILPTILNLFGLPYDSRLLVGKDVLSEDASDVAVLSDQSFITRDFSFETSTGKLTTFTDAPDAHQSAVEALQKRIATDFRVSIDVLGSDYYTHAIYGAADAQNRLEEYPFTDIPELMTLSALDYVYQNGYMDAISETKFGFDVTCTYAELLDILYRIEGKPPVSVKNYESSYSSRTITGKYAPAVAWAFEQGLVNEAVWHFDSFTPARRKDTSLTLYRYAAMCGADTSVDADIVSQYLAQHPSVTWDEGCALVWCFQNAIARADGTIDSVFTSSELGMRRFYIVSAIYNLYTHFTN